MSYVVPPHLRDALKDSLTRMLNLDLGEHDPGASGTIWKVLVFDNGGRDVISTVLKVQDLREQGVTVHMNLDSTRYEILDVPVVYLVDPTRENVRKILQDLSKRLYESFYIHFTTYLPRHLLEELAEGSARVSAQNLVTRIYDQYCRFICLEKDMFVGHRPSMYALLNSPSTSEVQIQEALDEIVSMLFCVLMTKGCVPVIRASKFNAAEMVATSLAEKIKDSVRNPRGNLFGGPPAYSTVLVILDRSVDFGPMVRHSWGYNAVIHDALDFRMNRITAQVKDGERVNTRRFDLDPEDSFWSKYSTRPFPEVADAVDSELEQYRKDADQLLKSSGATSIEEISQSDPMNPSLSARNLKAALTQLPELTARKTVIDMHMNIATSLLQTIKERQFDMYVEAEDNIGKQTKATMLDFIRNHKLGRTEDKFRFFLFQYLNNENVPKEDLSEYEAALRDAGVDDLRALTHIKKLRSIRRSPEAVAKDQGPGLGSQRITSDFFKGLGEKLTENLNLKEGGLASMLSTVKSFLPNRKDPVIPRIVEALMDSTTAADPMNSALESQFLRIDPRTQQNPIARFDQAIVFVIGGGNYTEYDQLQEHFQRQTGARRVVTYGTTHIASPAEFLRELAQTESGPIGLS